MFITIGAPDSWFATAVTAVAGVALWELYTMVLPRQRVVAKYCAITAGMLLLPVVVYFPQLFVPVVATLFIGFAIYFLLYYQDLNTVVAQLATIAMGWLYLPLLLSTMVLLHGLADGRRWVLLVLIMTMVCDSSAYFVGSAWGQHRLYPAISPKKSVEGAIGGLAGSVLAALSAPLWLLPDAGWVNCLMIGVLAGVLGQLGDLFESMIKRYADIKDSGTIFPGHGGMLDRIDSLLFSFPAVFVFLYFTLSDV